MPMAEFRSVLEVHVMGAVHCTKAVWQGMCERQYARIVMTTSSSALYGNFGQSNYGAAKMALVGLMQALALEGERHGIRVKAQVLARFDEITDRTGETVPATAFEQFRLELSKLGG